MEKHSQRVRIITYSIGNASSSDTWCIDSDIEGRKHLLAPFRLVAADFHPAFY